MHYPKGNRCACTSSGCSAKQVRSHAIPKGILKMYGAEVVVFIDINGLKVPVRLSPDEAWWPIHCEECDSATANSERKLPKYIRAPAEVKSLTSKLPSAERKAIFGIIVRCLSIGENCAQSIAERWKHYPSEVRAMLYRLNAAATKYKTHGLPSDVPTILRYTIGDSCPACNTRECLTPEFSMPIHSRRFGPILCLLLPPFYYLVPVHQDKMEEIRSDIESLTKDLSIKLHNRRKKAERRMTRSSTPIQSKSSILPHAHTTVYVGVDTRKILTIT